MNVLFICAGNVARSQEAEAYLRKLRPDLVVTSAGTEAIAGKPINDDVLTVTKEDGLDLRDAYRKKIDRDVLNDANYIVSFVRDSPLLRNTHINEFWDVADPRGGSLELHRATRDDIRSRVTNLATALI